MNIRRIAAILSLVLAASSIPAAAQDVTFSFRGRVVDVSDESESIDFAEGPEVAGAYTFNLSTPDSHPMAQVADYWHTSRPHGVVVHVGPSTFRTNPDNVNFIVEISNDYNSDAIVFHSYNNISTTGLSLDTISSGISGLHPDGARFDRAVRGASHPFAMGAEPTSYRGRGCRGRWVEVFAAIRGDRTWLGAGSCARSTGATGAAGTRWPARPGRSARDQSVNRGSPG